MYSPRNTAFSRGMLLQTTTCRLRIGVVQLHGVSKMNQRFVLNTALLEYRSIRINSVTHRLERGLATTQGDNITSKQKENKQNTILTEYVSGRTRIFTSLPTGVGSGRGSKQCISTSITSPLSWQWLQPQSDQMGRKQSRWSRRREKILNLGVLNSFRQSMREMFLPVG